MRRTFFFDAAACSGCKACQVACKDRHGLEVGRLWRRVSEVAGGGWARNGDGWRSTVFAYHLSMACNHCERPICLEGCPTRAIEQRADGVVLIDSTRCMGCGYCAWTCPYSAPQYHEQLGVMSKCSFCVEDLDAGLEPACVTACPVRALDAGDRDELAARHGTSDADAELAPLPAAALTEPALLLAPHAAAARSSESGVELTPTPPRGRREWSLVIFTLLSQAAAGLALFGGALRAWLGGAGGGRSLDPVILPTVLVLLVAALAVSMLHLGRRRNAARALRNLGSSWLSRELLLTAALLATTVVAWWPVGSAAAGAGLGTVQAWAGWLTVPLAAAFLFGMARVYMQRTVPTWDGRQTPVAFGSAALLLGGLLVNVVLWSAVSLTYEQARFASLLVLSSCAVVGAAGWWFEAHRDDDDFRRAPSVVPGALGAAAGLLLVALLLAGGEDPLRLAWLAPTLSWLALGLAFVDQLDRRRGYFARYRRLGV